MEPPVPYGLQFFLSHGGNLDIKDGDMAMATAGLTSVARSGSFRALTAMVGDEDYHRTAIQDRYVSHFLLKMQYAY